MLEKYNRYEPIFAKQKDRKIVEFVIGIVETITEAEGRQFWFYVCDASKAKDVFYGKVHVVDPDFGTTLKRMVSPEAEHGLMNSLLDSKVKEANTSLDGICVGGRKFSSEN